MRLSALQRHILRESYLPAGRQASQKFIPRRTFNKFYSTKISKTTVVNSITRSLERLIDKGLMIGFGRRTPRKWFIEEVRLTPTGRRLARQHMGVQQILPLK